MYILRFLNLFYKIKLLFPYLPGVIKQGVVDDMEELYELCLIAKYEKDKRDNRKKGVINEI